MFKVRSLIITLFVFSLLVAGCGSPQHHRHIASLSCAQATNGHGSIGVCAPKQKLGLIRPHHTSGPIYPDRSNNDPCNCGQQIKRAGQVGLIVKANQGIRFIDHTAVSMVASARAAHLAVGEYDFDQDYSIAEIQVFVARLHAAGIFPRTPNTFPAYIDVEFGNFNYGGLLAQIAYLHSQGYRVGIYTGQWYWGPHAGCRWPSGVVAWLSGYPHAPIPCGTTGYNAHQFTSTPIDLTVFLGSVAQFHNFVHSNPVPVLPICFKHRISKAQCAAAKRKITSYQRAVASSQRAYAARSCPILAQRAVWFRDKISTDHSARGKARLAYRRGALATTRKVYNRRACGTFSNRTGLYTSLIRQTKASN